MKKKSIALIHRVIELSCMYHQDIVLIQFLPHWRGEQALSQALTSLTSMVTEEYILSTSATPY